MKTLASVVALGLLAACPGRSGPTPDPGEEQLDRILGDFTGLMRQGKGGEAADVLLKLWRDPDPKELVTQRSQIVEAAHVNADRLGKVTGTEKVRTCHVGGFLYKSQTVVKHERGLVFWNFTFYNPGGGWVLESYRFDNKNFVPLTSDCDFK